MHHEVAHNISAECGSCGPCEERLQGSRHLIRQLHTGTLEMKRQDHFGIESTVLSRTEIETGLGVRDLLVRS